MIPELIATIILFSSLIGIGVILFKKIPILNELPEIPAKFDLTVKLLRIKEKIKNLKCFKSFSFEIILQKILSKIRILTLKLESKIDRYLQKLRKKSLRKKRLGDDNYWQKLKKITKKRQKVRPK